MFRSVHWRCFIQRIPLVSHQGHHSLSRTHVVEHRSPGLLVHPEEVVENLQREERCYSSHGAPRSRRKSHFIISEEVCSSVIGQYIYHEVVIFYISGISQQHYLSVLIFNFIIT